MKNFARPESVATAFSQGLVATEAAADHLHALDLLTLAHGPVLAPWTCARGLLEASAIATWLLNTRIDAVERVGRSMALRYGTLKEQRKLAEDDGNVTAAAEIDQRIDEVDAIAVQLSYPPVNDKNGRRISIGRYKPSITDLVDQEFDLKKVYRIFSGVAHCDIVTASQLGFKIRALTLGWPCEEAGCQPRFAASPLGKRHRGICQGSVARNSSVWSRYRCGCTGA
jgi:hypothetical protein